MRDISARASFEGSDLCSHMAGRSERPHIWFRALASDVKFLITLNSENSVASPAKCDIQRAGNGPVSVAGDRNKGKVDGPLLAFLQGQSTQREESLTAAVVVEGF